jgi:hypothetical protein
MVTKETAMKIKLHHVKAAVFGTLVVAAVLVVESKSAFAAFHHVGPQWALISAIFAILGTLGFGHAANLKDDYRPHIRRRALFTRIVSVSFMIVPIAFLGSAMKNENMSQRWDAYMTPAQAGDLSQYQQDVRVRDNPGDFDVLERNEARFRLAQQPGAIDLSILDAEFWMAAFLALSLLFGSDAYRVPAPMSKEEFEHLKRSLAAKKAAATRKARKQAKAAKPRLVVKN